MEEELVTKAHYTNSSEDQPPKQYEDGHSTPSSIIRSPYLLPIWIKGQFEN